jgi:hypothetical protein
VVRIGNKWGTDRNKTQRPEGEPLSLSGPRKNATKRGKNFLHGLKPIESTQFTSALSTDFLRKDFFRSPLLFREPARGLEASRPLGV